VGRRFFYFRAKLLEKTNRYCQKDKSLSLYTARLVLGIQYVKSRESKLCTALTRENSTENSVLPNKINSSSQDKTALGFTVFLTAITSFTGHKHLKA
jgi:hypothetical protein